MESTSAPSKGSLWAGRIISGIVVLFMIMDGGMKVAKASVSMEGSVALGWPEHLVQTIGTIALICTLLYVIPRTAIIGAILLTGYLGGAISVMMRANTPYWFPLVFGVLVWVGMALRGVAPHRTTVNW